MKIGESQSIVNYLMKFVLIYQDISLRESHSEIRLTHERLKVCSGRFSMYGSGFAQINGEFYSNSADLSHLCMFFIVCICYWPSSACMSKSTVFYLCNGVEGGSRQI